MCNSFQSRGEHVLEATILLQSLLGNSSLPGDEKEALKCKMDELLSRIPDAVLDCDDTADHCDEVHPSTQLETGERDSVPTVHMDKHLQVVRDSLDALQLMFLEERRRATKYEASATEARDLLVRRTTDQRRDNGTVDKDDCHENCRHVCEEMVELRNQLHQFAAAFAAFSVAFNTDRN